MSRKYDKNIVEEIELIRKNPIARDLFEQVSIVVQAYGGDTMMIASDLVCRKACSDRMAPAYKMADDLINAFGRCTFAGFLQVVEAWGRHQQGSDPSEALYFGEELLNWAIQLPVQFGEDPGDLSCEDPLNRGEFLEHLTDDVWAGIPINVLWDVPKIPVCEKSGVARPIDVRPILRLATEHEPYLSTYEGDFDKDFAEFKDHQYYKDFRLAAVQRGGAFEYMDQIHRVKRLLSHKDFARCVAITTEAIKRGHFK
jgi:hypothetical protein